MDKVIAAREGRLGVCERGGEREGGGRVAEKEKEN